MQLCHVTLLPPSGDSGYVSLRGQHPEARGHLSEALTEDTGVGNSVAGSPLPLTTGNENLDVAIVIHLQYCNHLVQVDPLVTFGNVPYECLQKQTNLCPACFFILVRVCWQVLTNGVSAWKRRSLLLKLSGQTQLLEELAEISVDRLGSITSAADGRH